MQKNKLIDKLFLIVVSILTILIGIVFIVQVLRIYYGNNGDYTFDICGKYLLEMLPIMIIWILSLVFSSVYFNLKRSSNKSVAKVTYAYRYKFYESMYVIDESFKNEYDFINKEKKKRKIALIINVVVLVICAGMSLGYLLNVKHFDSTGDLSKQAIDMGICLLPWVVISFGCLICTTIYEEFSYKKCIDVIKVFIKNGKKEVIKKDNNEQKIINVLRVTILTISIVLIIVGIFDGGAMDVLQKAINICTECIGLGQEFVCLIRLKISLLKLCLVKER